MKNNYNNNNFAPTIGALFIPQNIKLLDSSHIKENKQMNNQETTIHIFDLWSGSTIELPLNTIVYLTTVLWYNEIKVHEIKVQDLKEKAAYLSRLDAIIDTKDSIERNKRNDLDI